MRAIYKLSVYLVVGDLAACPGNRGCMRWGWVLIKILLCDSNWKHFPGVIAELWNTVSLSGCVCRLVVITLLLQLLRYTRRFVAAVSAAAAVPRHRLRR